MLKDVGVRIPFRAPNEVSCEATVLTAALAKVKRAHHTLFFLIDRRRYSYAESALTPVDFIPD
jgi:hypothetical protein